MEEKSRAKRCSFCFPCTQDGQFWQRYKVRTTDGLLQKHTARRGAVAGLERQGSSGVLNTSASQGSLQSYWNSCVGSGTGAGAAWGDLVNSELYNWVHHDSETAHQEALGAYANKQPSFFPHRTSFVACCQGRLRI
jgi:hypothetical protein